MRCPCGGVGGAFCHMSRPDPALRPSVHTKATRPGRVPLAVPAATRIFLNRCDENRA